MVAAGRHRRRFRLAAVVAAAGLIAAACSDDDDGGGAGARADDEAPAGEADGDTGVDLAMWIRSTQKVQGELWRSRW